MYEKNVGTKMYQRNEQLLTLSKIIKLLKMPKSFFFGCIRNEGE